MPKTRLRNLNNSSCFSRQQDSTGVWWALLTGAILLLRNELKAAAFLLRGKGHGSPDFVLSQGAYRGVLLFQSLGIKTVSKSPCFVCKHRTNTYSSYDNSKCLLLISPLSKRDLSFKSLWIIKLQPVFNPTCHDLQKGVTFGVTMRAIFSPSSLVTVAFATLQSNVVFFVSLAL